MSSVIIIIIIITNNNFLSYDIAITLRHWRHHHRRHVTLLTTFLAVTILGVVKQSFEVLSTSHHHSHNCSTHITKCSLDVDKFKWYMNLCMRKPIICIGGNKTADQLRGNREDDQRLWFRYTERIVQSLSYLSTKFQASYHLLWLYRPVCVRPGRNPNCSFLTHRLI